MCNTFRCYIPECDGPSPTYNASWLHGIEHNMTNVCERHPLKSFTNSSSFNGNNTRFFDDNIWNNSCNNEMFDYQKSLPCEKIIYEDNNGIVAEVIIVKKNVVLICYFIYSGS